MAQAKKNISVIPAAGTYDRHIRPQMKALRVAAYCRVSTCRNNRKAAMRHRSATIQRRYEEIPTGNWRASTPMTEKARPARKNARIFRQ